MSRFMLHLCGAISLCLSLGLSASHAHALSGPETAQRFNQAYASTVERCDDNYPAYYCSGVLVKQALPSDPQPFWSHGPDAVTRGAERFDYLRGDVATAPLLQASGYLLSGRFTAIAQGKDYQLVGDDGMSRPPELLVRNWREASPAQLPVEAIYYRRTVEGLRGALHDQYEWFKATGNWLPVLRLDATGDQDSPFSFDARDQLYSGYQVADRLNRRYYDTRSSCDDGRSALHCNGVLVRGTGYSPDYRAWNPSPNSIARDGVSFAWVRVDNEVKAVMSPGLIFSELSKPLAGSVRFRCAYPANAGTSGIANSCRASCAAQAITTVERWRARYAGNQGGSCTFDDTATEIQLNTDVRLGQSWSRGHNEMVFGAWPQDIPTQLPIEAFYYVPVSESLPGALYIQGDYLKVTGEFMPIVRVDLDAPSGSWFVYRPEDQSFSAAAMEQLRTIKFPPPNNLEAGDAGCVGCDNPLPAP